MSASSLSGIYADYKWKIENSGRSDPLYEFPIDELIPGENHSSFKYSVEDESLVIDKFSSERTLYIGNFPDLKDEEIDEICLILNSVD